MKKRKTLPKIVKALLILVLIGAITVIGLNAYICLSVRWRIVDINEIEGDYDCIIVLGAGVRNDGTPSHMLEDRLKTAISIYDAGKCGKLLMSGDHGREEYDEVNTMKDFAMDANIPETVIYLDHAGFSTYETMYRAKEIFQVRKAIIVSQEYHLYRALYLADSFGIEAVGVSADIRTYSGQIMRDIREVAARLKDLAYTIFDPEPTYLGDTIPISGPASATNG